VSPAPIVLCPQLLTRENTRKIFWAGTLLGTYKAHTAAMTSAHRNLHETRGRPGPSPGAWRPAGDSTQTGSPPGASAGQGDDPASLLGGDRLALTVTEAVSVLGSSRALAYELVARGELPSIRLGWRLVVPKVALLELLGLRPRREP
jgi:excisionase family DNA binding protein